jgi:transposase
MATERLSMRQLREVLRLYYEMRLSNRAIARSCSISSSTVSDYLCRAKLAKLGWPLADEMDDERLEKLLFPEERCPVENRPEPDYGRIHVELRRKHVTLLLLWQEYREAHPDGLQYSQFCARYREWAARLNPTMRQTHRAGEKVFVDFSGDGLIISGPSGGESRKAVLFVAVLGASNLTYVEPVLTQDLPTWLGCHVRAFEYFGGVSEIVVPDNPKVAVIKPNLYEPELNRSYAELARHYGVAIIPARSRKPRDKAKVEQGVLLAERWILAKLRNHTFFSLDEAKLAIHELVKALNARPMRRIQKSRRELFEELEKSTLKPLPAQPYELDQWARFKVNIDYHVAFEDHFYSVPYALIHEIVELRATETTIELFFKGRRVASHVRSREKNKWTTNIEHMPPSHRAHAEWTPSKIFEFAKKIGPNTEAVTQKIMQCKTHRGQGYRACLGIIRLREDYADERIEAACARAFRFSACSYKSIVAILKNNLDRLDEKAVEDRKASCEALPIHDNIRGADYYH